jgi:hypothetical protein
MVNVWLVALKVWACAHFQWVTATFVKDDAVIPDGVLGNMGVLLTKAFQCFYGLEEDGGIGPATRAKAKEWFGFDFDAVAAATPGETVFVQADGEEIVWSPAPVSANTGATGEPTHSPRMEGGDC